MTQVNETAAGKVAVERHSGRRLGEKLKSFFVKEYVAFVVVYTVLELALTGLYWMLVRRIDGTVFTGMGLYSACMITGYLSYRAASYKTKKKRLLDELLCEKNQ